MRTASAAVGALATATLVLTGCSGGSDEPDADEPTPAEVLEQAETTLDETPGFNLTLATEALPDGVAGVEGAQGVVSGTGADRAFDGTITVIVAGQSVDVPVISVDGTVYAEIPFTPGWSEVDPAEYGAPDPAQMVAPGSGFASLLPETEGVEVGEGERGGADNSEILTPYAGTVPGTSMQRVIPSASGDTFDVSWLITDDGELRQATLTGVFYPDTDPITYTVDFEDYGTEQDITAP